MYEIVTKIADSSDIHTLRIAAAEVQRTLADKRALLSHGDGDSFLCPVCQVGFLTKRAHGTILGVIDDDWLECGKCRAQFDQRLDSAKLVSAPSDPHGIFARFGGKRFPLAKWREIAYARTRGQVSEAEQALSTLITKIQATILRLLEDGTIKPILTDLVSTAF